MKTGRGRIGLAAGLISLLAAAAPAAAHAPGTSTAELLISERAVALRFRLDLGLLARLVWPDPNGDGRVTRREIEAVAPRVAAYLGRRIEVSLDDGPPSLGRPLGLLWPRGAGSVAAEAWPTTTVGFAFERPIERLPELVTVRYDVWPELGLGHRNWTTIRQPGTAPLVVDFSRDEPDYDYYTTRPASVPIDLLSLGARWALRPTAPALVLAVLLLLLPPGSRSSDAHTRDSLAAFALGHSIPLALAGLGLLSDPRGIASTLGLASAALAAGTRLLGWSPERVRALALALGASQGVELARPLVAPAAATGTSPAAGAATSLAAFHLGVEAGLLALAAALLAVRRLLPRGGASLARAVRLAAQRSIPARG